MCPNTIHDTKVINKEAYKETQSAEKMADDMRLARS